MAKRLSIVVSMIAFAVALATFLPVPADSAWEYTFSRTGAPSDRLEFKVEAHPAVLTGFRNRDDLPRGYQRYLTATGKRADGILCEVPWVLNHHDVNFAGVKKSGEHYVVVIGFSASGSRDYTAVTRKFNGRRVAVVVNHRLVAIIRISGTDEDGLVEVDGQFPKEVAEALVRVLYAEE